MQELQIFNNDEFGQVRTIIIDDEAYFVGKDIAEVLGYGNSRQALKTNVEEEDKGVHSVDTPSGKQKMTVVNESGMYSLILGSKLPTAKKFKHWITAEVLPALRKTGSYKIPKKQSSEERFRIMEMNARSRMAQTYMKLAQVDTLSSTYKNVLVSKASEVLAGEQIIPLPAIQQRKAYSAKEIGDMFGITANRVGRIANQHKLKQPQFGELRRDKSRHSSHECDTWVYFDTVIPEFRRILGIEVA